MLKKLLFKGHHKFEFVVQGLLLLTLRIPSTCFKTTKSNVTDTLCCGARFVKVQS